MLSKLFNYFVQSTPIASVIVEKRLHPLVDNTSYALNTTFMFGIASIIFLLGTATIFLPKSFYNPSLKRFNALFTWTGIFLLLEAFGRFDYTLLLLNLDTIYPVLYPMLAALRALETFAGIFCVIYYSLIYSKIHRLNIIEKRAEAIKKQTEAIFESSNDAILLTDHESTILMANKKVYETFGYRPEEIVGSSLDLLRPSSEKRTMAGDMKTYLKPNGFTVIGKVLDINAVDNRGHEFPVEISVGAYQIENKPYFIFTFHDLTIRKELQLEILKGKIRGSNLASSKLGNNRSLYVTIDPDTYEVVAVSEAYLNATGKSRDDLLGVDIFKAFQRPPGGEGDDAVLLMHQSLARVKKTLKSDALPVLYYPLLINNVWKDKYWSVINEPILNSKGTLQFINHKVKDVTSLYVKRKEKSKNGNTKSKSSN